MNEKPDKNDRSHVLVKETHLGVKTADSPGAFQ